jgi:CDP-glycerol glycerophosphotransferase (TagB/SpsB family)
VVYKPHPRVPTSEDPAVRAAHHEIGRLLTEADERDRDAGHATLEDADILGVLPGCDAMVTDVSSVGLDWLYLRTERPLFITDRHGDDERLRADVPVSRCADVVSSTNVPELSGLVADRLRHDELHLARVAMRRHYFDDTAVGQSTDRFVRAVGELCELRDRLLAAQVPQDPVAGESSG